MKASIIRPNESLKRLLMFTNQFEEHLEVQSFEELQKERKTEVIITGQNELTGADIIDIRSKFDKHKILVVMEKEDPFFYNSCIAHDILVLFSDWTEREQLDRIQKAWFGLEEQTEYHNVVAIHGTHRQVGVTQIALSVGHVLGSFNNRTIVLGLNPYNSGEIVTRKSTYSFDQIYDLLLTNVITDGESLLPYLEKVDQFYYLPGNRDFYKAVQFEGEAVERLIKICKAYFDIVILDVGAFYDSYLPIKALQMSNTHILVSSQEQLSIDEYKRWQDQVLSRFSFHPKSRYQIVNKHASKAIITTKHLEEKHDIPLLLNIPFFPEANDAEIESGLLVLADYLPYTKVIEGLAKTISSETGRYGASNSLSESAFRWFGRRKTK